MQWQTGLAILVFMAVVLAPAAIIWYLGITTFYRNPAHAPGLFHGDLRSGSCPRGLANRPLWIMSFVMVAYAVYGMGLASRWGEQFSLFLALAASVVLLSLGLLAQDKIKRTLASHRAPGLRLAIMVLPAFVTPSLIRFLMGGADWKVFVVLSLLGPAVLTTAFFVQWLSGTGRCSVVRLASRLGCHSIALGLFQDCQSEPTCLPVAVRSSWLDK